MTSPSWRGVVPGRPTQPVNWLLMLGVSRNGRPDLAERLRADILAAIEHAGFAEHFDPLTGKGAGGGSLSWTARAYLVLARSSPQREASL